MLIIDTRTKKSIRNMNDNDEVEEDALEKAIQSKYIYINMFLFFTFCYYFQLGGVNVDWLGIACYL